MKPIIIIMVGVLGAVWPLLPSAGEEGAVEEKRTSDPAEQLSDYDFKTVEEEIFCRFEPSEPREDGQCDNTLLWIAVGEGRSFDYVRLYGEDEIVRRIDVLYVRSENRWIRRVLEVNSGGDETLLHERLATPDELARIERLLPPLPAKATPAPEAQHE